MMRARKALSIDVKTWLKGLWLNVGLAFGADTKAAVVATIVSVLMGFTPIVVAIITRHFIDAFGPRPTVSPPEIVVVYALAYGTLQLGRVSLLAQRGRLTERIVASVTARLMRLPPRWIGIAPFENAAMYNDIQTVDRLIGMRSMGLVTTFGQGIAAVVSSGGVLILLARLDWRIAAAFVVVVLPSAVWQAREKMRATAIVQELAPDYRRLDYLLELATQPNTATDIRLRNGESFLEETYQSHAHRVLGQLRGLRAREGLRSLAVTVFGGLTLGGMAWWAALWALGGHWSSGELGMFFVAISEGQRALAQLYMFAASFADIARAIVTLSTVVHSCPHTWPTGWTDCARQDR